MTSFGSSCLAYMKWLKPELEERGFEVAIFHATGMGGMAFESIAAAGGFAAVMEQVFRNDETNCLELTLDEWEARDLNRKFTESFLAPLRPLL